MPQTYGQTTHSTDSGHDLSVPSMGLVGEELLPEYLQVLKITPVLNREQEIELFRRYNYLKHLVSQERHQLKLSKIDAKLLAQLEAYLDEAEEIRKTLVEANLRLVVSIAGKHTSNDASFLELVSKGNFALIQAVEEFDYAKGFRFSRRASLDIAKEYAKVSGRSTELTPKRAASLASIQRDLRDTTADVPGHRADPPEPGRGHPRGARRTRAIRHPAPLRPDRLVHPQEHQDPQTDRR